MGDLTTGEAEAWRAGWRAAQEAAAGIARKAEQNCQHAAVAEWGYSDSPVVRARIEARGQEAGRIAAAICAMQPPAAITNPPGRALEGG